MTTLLEKIWDAHRLESREDGSDLLYIDRQVLHEVTSAQAFAGLEANERTVRMPGRHIAMPDHSMATTAQGRAAAGSINEAAEELAKNTGRAGIPHFPVTDPRYGIVHVTAPEQGFVLPGCTVVCGDSHTATLGALGAIAFGVGTSEVEHVLATQSLWMRKPKTLGIGINGKLPPGVFAKDLALHIIGRIGTSGANGYAIEYRGAAVEELSIEGRLTLCNMSIEAGGRFGMIAPDQKTLAYLRGRTPALDASSFAAASLAWLKLKTDRIADYDKYIEFDAAAVEPMVTWGVTPADSTTFSSRIAYPNDLSSHAERERLQGALDYMGLKPGQAIQQIPIDVAFIGSCTNGRIEDLRAAASVLKGRKIADSVRGLVVPGSMAVRQQAEAEGLANIFTEAGFEWRLPGCSMCVAMNGDQLAPGQRCASTSNRNFENRQGPGGRTHLLSPASVAASALTGHLTDARSFLYA